LPDSYTKKISFFKKVSLYLAGISIVIAIWLLLSIILTTKVVPSPDRVIVKYFYYLFDVKILYLLSLTLIRSLYGLLLAFIIGLIIGLIAGKNGYLERISTPSLIILQTAPILIWIIPVTLISGGNDFTPIIVSLLVTLPIIIVNIIEGRKTITHETIDIFNLYRHRNKSLLRYLFLPKLSPYLNGIFTICPGIAFKSAFIAEWFSSCDGIGREIYGYFYTYEMTNFYALSLLFLTASFILTIFSKRISSHLFPVKFKTPTIYENGKNYLLKSTPIEIELNDISFSYGKRSVLNNLNLSIKKERLTVVTGPSGSGKTTLVKIITGLIKNYEGNITFFNANDQTENKGNKRNNEKNQDFPKTGYLGQEDFLLNHFTLIDNLMISLGDNSDDSYNQAIFYLNLCGLKEFAYHYPDEISGGMKKRVSLARIMLFDPTLVVLDEPFNNLDRIGRKELWQLYNNFFIERSIPSLIITHYPDELEIFNAKFYELNQKKLTLINSSHKISILKPAIINC